jgi:hypothetical protein
MPALCVALVVPVRDARVVARPANRPPLGTETPEPRVLTGLQNASSAAVSGPDGMPLAALPVSNLRFKLPVPAGKWKGALKVDHFKWQFIGCTSPWLAIQTEKACPNGPSSTRIPGPLCNGVILRKLFRSRPMRGSSFHALFQRTSGELSKQVNLLLQDQTVANARFFNELKSPSRPQPQERFLDEDIQDSCFSNVPLCMRAGHIVCTRQPGSSCFVWIGVSRGTSGPDRHLPN